MADSDSLAPATPAALMLKVTSALLILALVGMSLRAAIGMLKEEPVVAGLFARWQVARPWQITFGVICLLGSLLLLHPRSFVWGNYLVVAVILFMLVQFIHQHDGQGAAREGLAMGLALVVLWLGYPSGLWPDSLR